MAEAPQSLALYAQTGDLKAFEAFVRGQYRPLLAFLRGMLPTEEDAEDAAQETWLRLIRFCGAYRGGSETGYLMRIARSVVADRYRRRGLSTVSMSGEDDAEGALEVPDASPTPDRAFETRATAEDVRQAVRDLPFRPREVLLLRIEGGFTFREIAEELSLPLGTVLTLMRSATKRLKKKLGERT